MQTATMTSFSVHYLHTPSQQGGNAATGAVPAEPDFALRRRLLTGRPALPNSLQTRRFPEPPPFRLTAPLRSARLGRTLRVFLHSRGHLQARVRVRARPCFVKRGVEPPECRSSRAGLKISLLFATATSDVNRNPCFFFLSFLRFT